MDSKIYFDNVSTTSLNPEVKETYKNLLDKYFCNSDALYDDGVAIYELQEKSRRNIADLLGVDKDEIIFTAGASEANSLAIKGCCLNGERRHIVTSIYEHSSAYNSVRQLEEKFGFEVTYLKPDHNGVITAEQVKAALRPDTALVSIMMVNNEIGSINDISAIAEVVKHHAGTFFHTDITQAVGKVKIDLKNVDMASFSAHKIHGLKGSGVLMRRRHVELLPIISGGQQEMGIRGGTSNALTNIVLAKTLRIALEAMPKKEKQLKILHDYFLQKISEVEGVKINSPANGLVSLFNISTPVTSEVMLNCMNLKGIMISSKSTCGSRDNEENRTLGALGIDDDYAIRVSFEDNNTTGEIDRFIVCLKEAIERYARS